MHHLHRPHRLHCLDPREGWGSDKSRHIGGEPVSPNASWLRRAPGWAIGESHG